MGKIIILVSVGVFQDYIIDNIEQLLLLDYNVHVITNSVFFSKLDVFKNNIVKVNADQLHWNKNFDNNSKLDKHFRGGFWHNTSKRFFLIYEYIKRNNIKNALHIENDVLIYTKLNYDFENKLYLVMDCKNRCIPSILYIPSYVFLENLIVHYNYRLNDMINLAIFYQNNKNIIKTFPIVDNSINNSILNENYNKFDSIFDGAAIGQYLGGVDPRNDPGNTIGFVNETCVIKYDKYNFKWLTNEKGKFPYIEINKKLIPINNLHIHCKNLKKFGILYNINE